MAFPPSLLSIFSCSLSPSVSLSYSISPLHLPIAPVLLVSSMLFLTRSLPTKSYCTLISSINTSNLPIALSCRGKVCRKLVRCGDGCSGEFRGPRFPPPPPPPPHFPFSPNSSLSFHSSSCLSFTASFVEVYSSRQ